MPAELSSFVGRSTELVDVRHELFTARIVTLTGMGGVGKTRLALRAAREVQRVFRDGAWLVKLDELDDPRLLPETIEEALGIQDQSSDRSVNVLSNYLRDKQLLLVLDNCEHLIESCASLLSELLAVCAKLHVLVTSRQSLRICGEHIVPVQPLAVPPAGVEPRSQGVSAYPAVQLFAERAAAVAPSFNARAKNNAVIWGLCQRLDGVPLAIELAAARVRVLSPEQILDRLDDRFRLLGGMDKVTTPNDRALAAAFDWSYDLCSAAEQTLWARLSVFVGEFDLEAAEIVCCGDHLERGRILDLLTALVEKSILFCVTVEDSARYKMPETIREYTRQRLWRSDELAGLRRRHADYFSSLTVRAEAEWLTPRQVWWATRLRAAHTDIRMALDFLLGEGGDPQTALDMLTGLWPYWCACGLAKEASTWFERALPLVGTSARRQGKALPFAAFAAILVGDHGSAAARVGESFAKGARLGDEPQLAWAVRSAAWLEVVRGEYPRGLALYEEALVSFRALGEEFGTMVAQWEMAFAVWLRGDDQRGDLERAMDLARECVWRSRQRGEVWCQSFGLCVSGLVLWCRGEYPKAEELFRQSFQLKLAMHDLIGISICLDPLAWVAAQNGNYRKAATLFGVVAAIRRRTGLRELGTATRFIYYSSRGRDQARCALGFPAYRDYFERGLDLTIGQVAEQVLGSADLARPETSAYRGDGTPALSPRERTVAELIAKGQSNKEIAAELVISPRTAEGHVERIRAKLNCTSRAQIAARILGSS